MNKEQNTFQFIERLLDGAEVEWKPLGEVVLLEKGKQLNKQALSDKGAYPAYNGGVSFSGFTDLCNYSANKIIISQGGASAGFVNFVTTDFYANAHCYVVLPDETQVVNRYVFHFLKLNQEVLMGKQLGAGIPALRTNEILNLSIPIPCPTDTKKSLEIQRKLVEVLDKFTELEAELDCRKRQYEYYRNQLLSLDVINSKGNLNNVEVMTLGEIAEYSRTRISSSDVCENTFVGVDNLLQNKSGKTNSTHVPTEGNLTAYQMGDVLIGNIRPYLKKIWQADNNGGTSGDVLVIHLTNKNIIPRYLYQVLADDMFFTYNMQYAKGAKMPRGNKQKIMEYKIPIPPLAEQQRIVSILDKFEALTTSISEGLPKEIELRRKQYEYYRNQLLSFA